MSDFGRPTKYKPEYCEKLIEHMSQGLSFESFAGEVNVSRSTIYLWADEHPDFSDAKSIGASKCENLWEKVLVKTTLGQMNAHPTLLMFNMKCRFGWREPENEQKEFSVNLSYNLDEE